MISSMTAFARRELRGDFGLVMCEIRSVNHRYLEPTFRLSDLVRELEMPLREKLRQQLSRGKIDVWLKHETIDNDIAEIRINHALATRLVAAASEIDKMTRHAAPLNAADILRIPGVVCPAQPNQQMVTQVALTLFNDTLMDFIAMRQREGAAINTMISQRLNAIAIECEKVRIRMPIIMAHYRQRLLSRLQEVKAELNPERVEQEVVLFAHKIDVAEELDRLNAHIVEIQRVLSQENAVGESWTF